MARWTGTWISGLGAAGADPDLGRGPRGVRLGLPADGPGSAAGVGARAGAFAIDAVLSGLVARLLFPVRNLDDQRLSSTLAPLVVLAVVYLVGLALVGQTLGMRLLRLRVSPVRPPSGARPAGPPSSSSASVAPAPVLGLVPAALRTALLLLLIPALISDRDGRGLHDLAAGSIVVWA